MKHISDIKKIILDYQAKKRRQKIRDANKLYNLLKQIEQRTSPQKNKLFKRIFIRTDGSRNQRLLAAWQATKLGYNVSFSESKDQIILYCFIDGSAGFFCNITSSGTTPHTEVHLTTIPISDKWDIDVNGKFIIHQLNRKE